MKIVVIKSKRSEKTVKKQQVKAYYLSKLSNKASIKKVKSLITDILELDSLDPLEHYIVSSVQDQTKKDDYKRIKPVMISNLSFR